MPGFILRLMPWFIIHIHYLGAHFTRQTVYVSEGKSAVLKCQIDEKSYVRWYGPDGEFGSTVYTFGLRIHPEFSNKLTLVGNITNGEYNIKIDNLTQKDEGIYECLCGHINNYTSHGTVVTLIIQVKPKNLTIHGSVDGKLFGQEGKNLQLLCTGIIESPKETLTWYNMSSAIGTGGHEMLNITITPKRYDHKKTYTCQVSSASLQEFWQEIVTLEIQFPPTIRIIKNVTNRILRCEPDGIPQNYRYYRWQHLSEYRKLIRLLPNNQTILIEQNSANIDNFQLSGIYVCSAENGVEDIHGSIVQTGEVSVLLQDKPRFVAATESIQYGLVGTQIDISVMVYCHPEFSSVNILTSDLCCFNETKYQRVTDLNIAVRSFKKTVLMKGYKISLEGFTLTEQDFTTYNFWIQNEIGEETFSVKLIAKKNKFKSQSGYGPSWLLMGCVFGGILICSIGSNVYCYMKGKTRVNMMPQTYPEQHYDEIGTINYNNVVFEPTIDVTQENNYMSRVAGDSDILLGVESESSEESSLERLTRISQSGDGYENPYQSINPENIEMHPYSSLISNIYQNTIIFPASAGTQNTKASNFAEETSKTSWLIIYTKKQ